MGNKRLILSGVAILGLTCLILYPQATISILFGLTMSTQYISIDQERKYFSNSFNDSDTVILLPEKNIDESPKSEIEDGVNVDDLFKITSEKIFWIIVIVFMTIILVHMIKK